MDFNALQILRNAAGFLSSLKKGGPGSGRYPAGSGGEKKPTEEYRAVAVIPSKDEQNALNFAQKYPNQWHTHAQDKQTTRAIMGLKGKGLIEHSPETNQFRYNTPKSPENKYGVFTVAYRRAAERRAAEAKNKSVDPIDIAKDARRALDDLRDEFSKGGPGSGRYPAGSGGHEPGSQEEREFSARSEFSQKPRTELAEELKSRLQAGFEYGKDTATDVVGRWLKNPDSINLSESKVVRRAMDEMRNNYIREKAGGGSSAGAKEQTRQDTERDEAKARDEERHTDPEYRPGHEERERYGQKSANIIRDIAAYNARLIKHPGHDDQSVHNPHGGEGRGERDREGGTAKLPQTHPDYYTSHTPDRISRGMKTTNEKDLKVGDYINAGGESVYRVLGRGDKSLSVKEIPTYGILKPHETTVVTTGNYNVWRASAPTRIAEIKEMETAHQARRDKLSSEAHQTRESRKFDDINDLFKGGPGSGRYPAGSGGERATATSPATERADKLVERAKSEIDAPHVQAYKSTLGGQERASTLITVSLDPKEEWPNGILQNSRYAQFHIGHDGKVEHFSGNLPKIRTKTVKDDDEAIAYINSKLKEMKEGSK